MPRRIGRAVVSDEAFEAIVRCAVARVPGARLDDPGRVSRVLPRRRSAVTWVLSDDGFEIDVDLAASHGEVLPELAANVRRSVAGGVQGMTGRTVRSVDVTVTGLDRGDGGER